MLDCQIDILSSRWRFTFFQYLSALVRAPRGKECTFFNLFCVMSWDVSRHVAVCCGLSRYMLQHVAAGVTVASPTTSDTATLARRRGKARGTSRQGPRHSTPRHATIIPTARSAERAATSSGKRTAASVSTKTASSAAVNIAAHTAQPRGTLRGTCRKCSHGVCRDSCRSQCRGINQNIPQT